MNASAFGRFVNRPYCFAVFGRIIIGHRRSLSETFHYSLLTFHRNSQFAESCQCSAHPMDFDCLAHKILGHIKMLRKCPHFVDSVLQSLSQLSDGNKPQHRPSVRPFFVFFTDFKRRICTIKRQRFAMPDFVGKMHPLLRRCFYFKRVDSDKASACRCFYRYGARIRQIATDDLGAARFCDFIKLTCSRFFSPPLLQRILQIQQPPATFHRSLLPLPKKGLPLPLLYCFSVFFLRFPYR